MKRFIGITLMACIIAFGVLTGTASAAHSVVLSAPHSVAIDYTHCYRNGMPLPCLAVEGSVTNNALQTYSCQVVYINLAMIVFDSALAPSQTLEWNIVTGYTGQSWLTFVLSCNGSFVVGQTARVHITK